MLTGFAFLDSVGKDFVDKKAAAHRLTEVEVVECWDCHVRYRLFTGPNLPKDEAQARSEIKDLRERLLHMIALDCPNSIFDGQPKKTPHHSQYEFLESGRVAD